MLDDGLRRGLDLCGVVRCVLVRRADLPVRSQALRLVAAVVDWSSSFRPRDDAPAAATVRALKSVCRGVWGLQCHDLLSHSDYVKRDPKCKEQCG